MDTKRMEKYSKTALIIGVVMLILSIASFIVVAVSLNKVSSETGMKLTASELSTSIQEAEKMSKMLGGGDVGDMLGVSNGAITLVKIAIPVRIPFLIIGVLMVGFAIFVRSAKGPKMEHIKDGLASAASGATAVVKKAAVEVGTVKCPNCGKVQAKSAAFCNGCGKKLEEIPKPAPEAKTTCPKCGRVFREKVDFCSGCGSDLRSSVVSKTVEIKPKDPVTVKSETTRVISKPVERKESAGSTAAKPNPFMRKSNDL